MTFQEFIDAASSEKFLLKETNPRTRTYVFENPDGSRRITAAIAPSSMLNDSLPNWEIDIDGDKVSFEDPAELNSANFIVESLFFHSLVVALNEIKPGV